MTGINMTQPSKQLSIKVIIKKSEWFLYQSALGGCSLFDSPTCNDYWEDGVDWHYSLIRYLQEGGFNK